MVFFFNANLSTTIWNIGEWRKIHKYFAMSKPNKDLKSGFMKQRAEASYKCHKIFVYTLAGFKLETCKEDIIYQPEI